MEFVAKLFSPTFRYSVYISYIHSFQMRFDWSDLFRHAELKDGWWRFMKTKTKRRTGAAALDPKKFKRLPRGSFLARAGETEPRNTKVRISILVDLDVLNFFKERASKAGALAYQTQINRVLRAEMEGKESLDANTLAQDDRFIRAVAKRVKQLSSNKRESA